MSSAISDTHYMDVQKIVVTLDQPDLVIDPGSATRLVVTMTNQQDAPDRLLLEVEGIDIEWYNIPVSAVNVAPGETTSERINFKMTRNSENRAGSYPFLVRVVAMETGEVGVAQAMLIVKPYDSLQVEMSPRRATSTFFHPLNDFEVTVVNEGNSEEALELFASDPDDECVYEFDTDHVALKPGQTQTVLMAARPKASAWVGTPHLYSFQVSARSSEDRYVAAKTQGQLERRALVSPFAGLFLLLLGLGAGGYVLFKPTPPIPVKLNTFAVTPDSVTDGKPVTVTWDVSGDKPSIKLSHHTGKQGTEVMDGTLDKGSGNAQYPAFPPQTTYTLSVTGPGNDGKWQAKSFTVNVTPAPTPPKPVISEFTADLTKVHVGDPVVFSWKGKNADSYILDPGGFKFSSYDQTSQVAQNYMGDVVYTLRALSADKRVQSDPKTVKITIVSKDTSIADVLSFDAASKNIYIGEPTRLRWVTKRAVSVRIDNDRGDIVGNNLNPSGNLDVTVNERTTYTLTAVDNLGKITAPRIITLTPRPKPLPPPEPVPVPPPDKNTAPNTPLPPNDGANPLNGGKTP